MLYLYAYYRDNIYILNVNNKHIYSLHHDMTSNMRNMPEISDPRLITRRCYLLLGCDYSFI